MNNPELMQKVLATQSSRTEAAKPEVLILLNYVPNLNALLEGLEAIWGHDYQLSVLGTDAVMAEEPGLPAGMRWVACLEAISQSNWQRILIPACSANTLAKLALGIRDNSLCEIAGRAIAVGIPIELTVDYLGFTPLTPPAYRQCYAGYAEILRQYGVMIKDPHNHLGILPANVNLPKADVCDVIKPQCQPVTQAPVCAPVSDYTKAAVICWEGKLLTEQDAVSLPEESVIKVARKAIISPLAKDKLRQRNIEVVREMEV